MNFRTTITILALVSARAWAADPVFSGPQIGEPVSPFEARPVFGERAGETIKVMSEPRPSLLIFVHEVTRPAIGLARLVVQYATQEEQKDLHTNLVFLSDDRPTTEQWMSRARHALPKSVSPMIAEGGLEGPGSYGLNRHVQLTVIVAKQGKVTDNFALVQPSVQVDAPKIGAAIAKVLGRKQSPTLKDMGFKAPRGMQRRMNAKDNLTPEQNAKYRALMAPVIRGETEADVSRAAKELEEQAEKHPWLKNKVQSAASMIVEGGKLPNYGRHEKAREFLKKWARGAKKPVEREGSKPSQE